MTSSARLVTRLTELGQTVACAESLTAGLLAATIADTPGASLVLRGGVVAYAPEVKVALLGVDAALIARAGTVDARVAVAMAEGVRELLDATWGLATTGVAGPGPAEGKPAGTVHVAIAGPTGTRTWPLRLTGTRAQIRRGTVAALLELAERHLCTAAESSGAVPEPEGTVGESAGTDAASTRRTT